MGYRNPGYDEVEDAATQFEWDGERQRWLFYRNGSHAPVIVEESEKDRCEALQKWGGIVVVAFFMAVFVLAEDRFASLYTTRDAKELGRLTAFGAGLAVYILGRRSVDWFATLQFRNRLTAGPARAQVNAQLVSVEPNSHATSVMLILFAGFLTWMHLPPAGLADWIMLGVAALFAVISLASLWPVRKPRSL